MRALDMLAIHPRPAPDAETREDALRRQMERIRSVPGWDVPDKDEDDHPVPLCVRVEAAAELRDWVSGGGA